MWDYFLSCHGCSCRTGKFQVKIPPIVGEIIQGAVMTEADFKQRSSKCSAAISDAVTTICVCVTVTGCLLSATAAVTFHCLT